MNRLHTEPPVYAVRDSAAGSSALLQGRALAIARGAWLVVATLAFMLVLISIPAEYARFQVPCSASPCPFLALWQEDLAALARIGLSADFFAGYLLAGKASFMAASLVVGTALFWRKSDQRIALFVALSLVTLGSSAFSGPLDAYVGAFDSFWQGLALVLAFVGNTTIVLCFYLFPDGRFVPSWIKIPAILFVLLQLDEFFFNTFFEWLQPADLWLLLFYLGSMIYAQVYRYLRVSGKIERQQTKWVVLGITGTVLGTQFVDLVLPHLGLPHLTLAFIGNTLYYFSLLLIPLSIGMAILRYRLWDIDNLINRTLVYGTLTVLVIVLYVLIVGSLSALLPTSGNLVLSLIATGVIAVLFQPLRECLQRGANRLLYGERDDPYSVLSDLGRRLGETASPEALLPSMVETIAQALKVPYVAVELRHGSGLHTAAAYGRPSADLVRLPLIYQGEDIGELALARRARGEAFSKADMDLLRSIAHEAGMAAHSVQLTADLQRSRERLVTAREEERRRLRRDLHDGLGPVLGGLTLKLDAARNLLTADPVAADKLLVDLKAHTQSAIADIRRLVYELRPPALDDLGLASALREHAAQCNSPDGLHVTVELPERLPPLSAAVEVATYRIAQEATNNVVRHAGARNCHVCITIDTKLRLEITDDGSGISPDRHSGVGLNSMRERAEELGGTFEIGPAPGWGTRVLAQLPLANDAGSAPTRANE